MLKKVLSFGLAMLFGASFVMAAKKASTRDPLAGLADGEQNIIQKTVIEQILKDDLQGARFRIFSTDATIVKSDEGLRQWSYTLLYDYTHNKTLNVVMDTTDGVPGKLVEVMRPTAAPPFSREEYAEARTLVSGLDRVQKLLANPQVKLQDSFPKDNPAPCDIDRCVEIQVNELPDDPAKRKILLWVTVDLSLQRVTNMREFKN